MSQADTIAGLLDPLDPDEVRLLRLAEASERRMDGMCRTLCELLADAFGLDREAVWGEYLRELGRV